MSTVIRMADHPLTIESINAVVAEEFPGSPGRCIEIGDGYAVSAIDVGEASIRPGGYVSGPTQFGLIDTALWYLTFVAIGRIEPMALTSELSIRFLRPAIGSRIVCRADLEAVNRRSVIGTARVWVDGTPDKITATGQGTYAIPLPR